MCSVPDLPEVMHALRQVIKSCNDTAPFTQVCINHQLHRARQLIPLHAQGWRWNSQPAGAPPINMSGSTMQDMILSCFALDCSP